MRAKTLSKKEREKEREKESAKQLKTATVLPFFTILLFVFGVGVK